MSIVLHFVANLFVLLCVLDVNYFVFKSMHLSKTIYT
jgi:hypothetical protein